jgi:hypothetical protein
MFRTDAESIIGNLIFHLSWKRADSGSCRRLPVTLVVVSSSLALVAAADAASAAPRQLYGKSVTVSWSETRSQRRVGEQAFRPVTVSLQRNIYVSSAGRVFSRTHASTRRGSGSAESIGTGGTNFSGGARNVQFQGNSLIMTAGFTGAARRVQINFDSGFQSCSAQVITAKQVGARTGSWRGIAGQGARLEVESVSAGPASCSIRSGNVFAE